MPLRIFSRKKSQADASAETIVVEQAPGREEPPIDVYEPANKPQLHQDSLHRQLQLGRFGIITTNAAHWQNHPDLQQVLQQANAELDQRFALVPEGFVSIPQCIDDSPGCEESDWETEAFLLAQYPVTNAEYQLFVDVGAYSELELWPEEAWPHLIDLKDQTGQPGPRFWREGLHDQRLADHPVVGICHWEAEAYARWAGYRLPSEAEWQMAASWQLRSSANVLRRYPWGDAFDVQKCNVWISGVGRTVPVDRYEKGAAPNGVCQLVGNVWEWTGSVFEAVDAEGNPVVGDMLMMSVRGGAFDTYFASQATSSFRTGLATLARAHNVGFRCAMDLPKEQ